MLARGSAWRGLCPAAFTAGPERRRGKESSSPCTQRLAENCRPRFAIQYQDTSHRNLRLRPFPGSHRPLPVQGRNLGRPASPRPGLPGSCDRCQSPDTVRALVGTALLRRRQRDGAGLLPGVGLLRPATLPVPGRGPPLRVRDPADLNRRSLGDWNGWIERETRIARYPVHLASEFAPGKVGHCPPMTCLGVDPLERGLEVSSLHYYPQESTAVLSRSVTVVQ